MTIRRLVTGNVDGQSVVLSDGVAPRNHEYESIPGFSTALVWSTSSEGVTDSAGKDPISPSTSYIPGPGETRLLIVSFPPDSVFVSGQFDPAAAYAEQQEHLTGLVDHFDPEIPGMHSTPTIDYGIVLEGNLWLELSNGVTKELEPHSIIVQQGNVHAWRNLGDKPAKIAFVLIGIK
jgi:hypothetical protein